MRIEKEKKTEGKERKRDQMRANGTKVGKNGRLMSKRIKIKIAKVTD